MGRQRATSISLVVIGLLGIMLAACSATGGQPGAPSPAAAEPTRTPAATGPIVSHGGPVRDHVSFVDALRAKGLTVEIVGPVEQPFLRGNGTVLRMSGGNLKQVAELQSFNYSGAELGTDGVKAAAEDASQIDANGNPKTMRILWIAPPHFFRKERVIVIYVGSDANTVALLTDLLGPQFAGK